MKTRISYFAIFTFIFIFNINLHSQSWEGQAIGILPAGYGVFAISVVDENVIWAVAFDQSAGGGVPLNHITKVIKTIDGGVTWDVFDVEEAQGRISFDIVAFDANTAFITTQDLGNGIGRGIFKTEDGGNNWVEKFNHDSGGVWIRFFNSQEGVIINRHLIATTEDGGDTWQLVPSSNIPPYESDEFTILSTGNNSCQVVGDHVWFGTSKGRIYRSKDNGYTWEVFNTTLGNNAFILSVAFKDTLNGIAIDVNSLIPSFNHTADGGETWENITPSPEMVIANLAFIPGTESTLIGTSDVYVPTNDRVSAYSTDFGLNWEIINDSIPFGGTQFIASNIGWTSRAEITSPNQAAMFKWEGEISVNTTDIELEKEFSVFPNPSTNNLNIVSFKNLISDYSLFSSDGHLIRSGKIDSNQSIINLESLNFGVYHLELIFDDGSKTTRNIIKVN